MGARRLGVVMDPIGSIDPRKDSTLALLLEAQAREWTLHTMGLADLCAQGGRARATARSVTVRDDLEDWFDQDGPEDLALADVDVVLLRTDPPVDARYVTATHLLERAEAEGTLVVNRPGAVRDAHAKTFAALFPQCTPETLYSASADRLRAFLAAHGKIVVKPIDALGGRSVFVVREGDPNTNVILEELTRGGERFAQAQVFVEEVVETGDKRILLVDGEPVPKAIVRRPRAGDFRANLAAGASAEGGELTDRDRWICAEIGPTLRERGLLFAGIDVIGGYLTEVNVVSPTCIRECDAIFGVDVAATVLDAIDRQLA